MFLKTGALLVFLGVLLVLQQLLVLFEMSVLLVLLGVLLVLQILLVLLGMSVLLGLMGMGLLSDLLGVDALLYSSEWVYCCYCCE